MITFNESDWNDFCNELAKGSWEPRKAIKWITAQRVEVEGQGCQHDRTREISLADGGKKVFCMSCNVQVRAS